MRNFPHLPLRLFLMGWLAALAPQLHGQAPLSARTVPVRLTVTASGTRSAVPPPVTREDVMVFQGKERLQVQDWVRAQGSDAGLELVVLIDDACHPSLGAQFDDLADFFRSLPPTTSIAIAYASDGVAAMAQNFTQDRAQAIKALRLPRGILGTITSPYLSLMDLIARLPANANRREVLLISDGIDRFRRTSLSPDVDNAIEKAQRAGILVHTIYAPGVGHAGHNLFWITDGETNLAKLTDHTGGEQLFTSLQAPFAFGPYLQQFQNALNNQYLLTVLAKPGKKAGLQSIRVTTELSGVELNAQQYVYVPAAQ